MESHIQITDGVAVTMVSITSTCVCILHDLLGSAGRRTQLRIPRSFYFFDVLADLFPEQAATAFVPFYKIEVFGQNAVAVRVVPFFRHVDVEFVSSLQDEFQV